MLPLVVDVERIVVRVPFRERVAKWTSIMANHVQVIEVIRVTTEDPDVVGYGETMIDYIATRDLVSDAAIARVIGSSPAEHMSDDTIGAGLQIALYDATGKATGLPMYQLLGKPMVRQWCPVSWWNMEAPPEVLAEEAKTALAQGYMSHKIKARPWFDIYEQVAQIAAVTPNNYAVDIDWNTLLLQSSNAIPVLERLSHEERVGIYEDPIPREDVIGQKALLDRVSRPIFTHFNEDLFALQMRENAMDGYVVDGGVHRALRIGSTLAANNKSFFLQFCGTGITVAMSLHVASVLSHARAPSVSMVTVFSEDLLAEPLTIRGGFARVPEGPGLGIQVDEAALTRLAMSPPFKLELPRRIYSFVLSDGRARHYATSQQLWADSGVNGTMPVQSRGSRLDLRDDDGSADFNDLFLRASRSPVWDVPNLY
jgi:L-alanine-DL-glutamate epimerase-like enolase superfamily enzyme